MGSFRGNSGAYMPHFLLLFNLNHGYREFFPLILRFSPKIEGYRESLPIIHWILTYLGFYPNL